MKISPPLSVIGHRGASADRPENTLDAFEEARRQGADWVELDVRATSDGALGVLHDAHLPDGRAIAETRQADLPASVPTLAEALGVSVPMGVNVEIKHQKGEPGFTSDRHLADMVVAVLLDSPVEVLVSSFDLATIDRVRHLAPELATAYLVMDASSPIDAVGACVERGHAAIHPWDPIVDAALVDRAHGSGIRVNVWTVDDPARIVELARLGVDGIVTNRPAAARAALEGAAG